MRVKCSVYRFLLHTHIEGSENITVFVTISPNDTMNQITVSP